MNKTPRKIFRVRLAAPGSTRSCLFRVDLFLLFFAYLVCFVILPGYGSLSRDAMCRGDAKENNRYRIDGGKIVEEQALPGEGR